MSSPSGAVSTLIGLFSFAGPALRQRHRSRTGCLRWRGRARRRVGHARRIGAAAQCIVCTLAKKCSPPPTTLGCPSARNAWRGGADARFGDVDADARARRHQALVAANLRERGADDHALGIGEERRSGGAGERDREPLQLVAHHLEQFAVPAQHAMHAAGGDRIEHRWPRRIGVSRRQRDHDWMTASLTTPENRVPSSKKRWRASATRCSGEPKNGFDGSAGARLMVFTGRVGFGRERYGKLPCSGTAMASGYPRSGRLRDMALR